MDIAYVIDVYRLDAVVGRCLGGSRSCQEEMKSFAEASGLAICKTSARSGQGRARSYRA